MANACRGEVLDCACDESGHSRRTTATQSRYLCSPSHWRECRDSPTIPTWSNQPPLPPTGPLPALVRISTEQLERQFVISRARQLATTGTVAILFRTRKQEWSFPDTAVRLHRDLNRWPARPGIFYGTYHAAKGLEFDTVFLPRLSSDNWPLPDDVQSFGREEATERNSRLLYVGVTRARSTLVLSYSGTLTALLPPNRSLYQFSNE